jgi:YaiO family outer membrane protein
MLLNKFHFSIVFILSILLAFINNPVNAQDTTTSDGLFQAARKAAFEKDNYAKAKIYCQKALTISPQYADIRIFLGRLYGWDKVPDSARLCFIQVLDENPGHIEASFAYAELEYRNDNYGESLSLINKGLLHNTNAPDLLLLKAKVLNAGKNYREASDVIDGLLKQDRDNADARALASRIKENAILNKVGISYDYVHFNKQFDKPWHMSGISYTRQTKSGSVTGRINYANRFGSNGIQYEMDAYPRISKIFYAYVSLGYSDNIGVFPHWRSGLSLYANLPKSFEAEVGWRYLNFSAATNIYTGYLGKYYKNYLFGVRTYVTPGGGAVSHSYNALARYYFRGAQDFVGLTLGTGISPDDRSVSQQLSSKTQLKTYKAALDIYYSLTKFDAITFNASLINQEYLPQTKGNQIQLGAGYQRNF